MGVDVHGAQPVARLAGRLAVLEKGDDAKAAPALLKWTTLATPGVSDLSNGTSSVIC
jgi:hypothetical protein